MKFKEKLNQAAGFTLVELIVVIAILAILAGVAVPAYSGYITQANKSNDETLASEIKQALMLAYYAGNLKKGAAVVVYYGDKSVTVVDEDSKGNKLGADQAMKDAFGDNYATSLKLSWDGWDSTGISGNIAAVTGSSFDKDNVDVLLKDVAILTQAVNGFIGSNPSSAVTEVMQAYAAQLGLDISDISNDGNVLANLVPMMVADNLSERAQDAEFATRYNNVVSDLTFAYKSTAQKVAALQDSSNNILGSDEIKDKTAAYAMVYAQMEGLVRYILGSEAVPETSKIQLQELWDNGNSNITNAITVENGLDAVNNYILDEANGCQEAIATYYGASYDNGTVTYDPNAQIQQDNKAFLAYMDGVSATIPTLTEDTSTLTNANYYTSTDLSKFVLNYITAGELLSGEDNALLVLFDGEEVVIYPIDYTA